MSQQDNGEGFKIICISLYDQDVQNLDEAVSQLKERGLRRANRSWLIRYALARIDLDAIQREDVYGKHP